MASKSQKWRDYADKVGIDLSDLLNKNIRETVKTGIRAVVTNTVQDSGRAAFHWVVVPNKVAKPGYFRQLTFNPAYGQPPVGYIGDQGKNSAAVISAVVSRESSRAVDATVKGRKGQATAFLFQSNVPGQQVDPEWGRPDAVDNYRRNAQLKEAKEAALSQMQAKWQRQIAAGNQRKRPVN